MLGNRLAPIAEARRKFAAYRTEDKLYMHSSTGFWTEDILTGIKGRATSFLEVTVPTRQTCRGFCSVLSDE